MTQNVGGIDRLLRLIVGAAILSLLYFKPEYGYWPLIGIVPLFTAVVGWCPPYALLGLSTCKR